MLKHTKRLFHKLFFPKSKVVRFASASIYTFLLALMLLIEPSDNIRYSCLQIPNIDKVIHACIFGIFVLLWFIVFNKKVYLGYILMLGVMYSIFLETAQYFIPKRQFDYGDIVANIAGICISYMLIMYYEKKNPKKTL